MKTPLFDVTCHVCGESFPSEKEKCGCGEPAWWLLTHNLACIVWFALENKIDLDAKDLIVRPLTYQTLWEQYLNNE